ncbi:MAG: ABC transporter ATP-binding protein [Pseudomonadota bacterium]
MPEAPLLDLKGITRRFPGVLANDHVDFSITPGEIHALLGENGAGKSTLMKIIAGLLAPDEGEIRWQGQPVTIRSPIAARDLGIGMVHQHFALFEGLSVAENIALSLPKAVPGAALTKRLNAVAEQYGLELDPDTHVFSLSAGEKQRIEIVRTLLQDPKLLILDEPTSVLTPGESRQLFDTLRRLSDSGTAIVFISHKLQEVRELCDHATILRGGKVVADCRPSELKAEQIAELMLGERPPAGERIERPLGETRLQVSGLKLIRPGGAKPLEVEELALRSGEIVGVAGVAGNGQEALYRALSGEDLANRSEAILFGDVPVGRRGPNARRGLGVAFLPEERLGHAAVPNFTLTDNALLSNLIDRQLQRRGWIFRWRLARRAQSISDDHDVRHSGIDQLASGLSGGNLQKFVVGRELDKRPTCLVIDQPTWGVDPGAANRIRGELQRLAAEGAAILIISQDLDELLEMCDRLAVLHEGHLSATRPVEDWTIRSLGLAMTGAEPSEAQPTDAAPLQVAQ